MKLDTRIVIPVRYNSDYECDTCLKVIDGMLYSVVMGQEIKLVHRGEMLYTKVIGISDSVYDDAIYRYIEVVAIDRQI